MTIQPINEFDVALFIGRKDLEQRGLSPEILSMKEAKKMAQEAFSDAGIDVEGGLEIEAFAAESGVLVFARRMLPLPAIFIFPDFETLLDAVEALGDPGETASITYLDGWWYACIVANSRSTQLLGEFGERLECAPSFAAHLKEHGDTVLYENRTGLLRAYFVQAKRLRCGIIASEGSFPEEAHIMKQKETSAVAKNNKAYHEYFIEETFEAGIVLSGTEVKSIRQGNVNLRDAFCTVKNGEIYVIGMHISPYEKGNIFNRDPKRERKLLMHKREILRLFGKVKQDGLALIPLSLYFKDDHVKMQLALAKGKKLHDKREDSSRRDAEREMDRAIKNR